MTALAYEDALPQLAATTQVDRRRPQRAAPSGDPLADAAARLLSIPLHHVYAVLWRVGLIEVTA